MELFRATMNIYGRVRRFSYDSSSVDRYAIVSQSVI